MDNQPPDDRTTEDARERRRIRETTPGPGAAQSPTATGDAESGTGSYGVEIGAGRHRGFGPDDDDDEDDAARAASATIRGQLEAAGISADVEVHVVDRTATLEGLVEDERHKRAAEEVVRRAPGVDDVANLLRVRPASSSRSGRVG